VYSLEASDEPEKATLLRERLSLALTVAPFAAVLVFFLANPSVWATDLAVFFSRERDTLRSDAAWVLSALALVSTGLCALVGLLGTRESWKHNRRWQRGILGSLAAVLTTVLVSSWLMTQEIDRGEVPDASLAMFATVCAMLYGVLCAAVSPRDVVTTWYPDTPEGDEEIPPPSM